VGLTNTSNPGARALPPKMQNYYNRYGGSGHPL
jgi:hypothetical protein